MYSGSTFVALKRFDAWFGVHQKIDRIARRNLLATIDKTKVHFPTAKQIIRFEGLDGPDGIKRKSPAKNEPWHYYDPYDKTDNKIVKIMQAHNRELVQALRTGNDVRAAFEAAWLAHAIVDGLTPAHHYPYEEELVKLRGEGLETRSSIKGKLVLPGDTLTKQVHNNWKMWGDKGLLASHLAFEMGVATIITPIHFRTKPLPAEAVANLVQKGFPRVFKDLALQIAELDMYGKFGKSGWTPKLAKQVRRELMPLINDGVALAWYAALHQAGMSPSESTV